MMKQSPKEVASAYMTNWENAWNSQGPAAVTDLYMPDGMLVGAATGIGRPEIERLLEQLFQQGWRS